MSTPKPTEEALTSGDWRVTLHGGGLYSVDAIDAEGGRCVADCGNGPNAKANATAISGLPALLAERDALKKATVEKMRAAIETALAPAVSRQVALLAERDRLREALDSIARGLTNVQHLRGETLQGLARAALATTPTPAASAAATKEP